MFLPPKIEGIFRVGFFCHFYIIDILQKVLSGLYLFITPSFFSKKRVKGRGLSLNFYAKKIFF